MSQNPIFRDELPGEKKSIITLLMTGYFVAVSCMGYMAFYIYVQLSQMDRVIVAMNREVMTKMAYSSSQITCEHANAGVG